MGVIWSRLAQGEDYERILADLLTRISELEVHLSETRHQHRRLSLWILLYGALLYLLAILYVFLYPRAPATLPYRPILDASMLLLGPLLVYYLRRLVGWGYGRKIASLETRLRHLRAKQKLKVEELKKATAYYRTKGLLERFEINEATPSGKPITKSPARTKPASVPPSHSIATNGVDYPIPPDIPRRPTTGSPRLPLEPCLPFGMAPPAIIPPPSVTPPTWMDRLVDALIGDDRNTRYALICSKCYAHNGLVPPEELEIIQYICPNCHHLQLPRIPSKSNPSKSTLDVSRVNPSDLSGLGSSDISLPPTDVSLDAVAADKVNAPEASSSSSQDTPKQAAKRAAVIRQRPSRRNSNPERLLNDSSIAPDSSKSPL